MTTVNIDFVNSQSTPDAGWNNADVDPTTAATVIADLVDSNDASTGLTLKIESIFAGRTTWLSADWPSGDPHGWPDEVWRDVWYADSSPIATLLIEGFTANEVVNVTLAGENGNAARDTDYYDGNIGTFVRYNNNGDISNPAAPVSMDFEADASGDLRVQVVVVSTFGYINALTLSYGSDITGNLAATENTADSASFSGEVPVDGDLAATDAVDTADIDGTAASGVEGDLSATDPADSASVDGDVKVQGSVSVTESGISTSMVAARASDGSRRSAFPNGPSVDVGNAALGAFSWEAMAEGGTLVIHTDGTNDFGSGPDQSKILYDEFDGGTDGADIDLTTTQGQDWDEFGTNTPKYETSSPHSGTAAMRGIDKDLRRSVKKIFSPTITEVYLSFAIRVAGGNLFPYAIEEEDFSDSSVLKPVWMLGPNDSTVLSDMVIASRIDSLRFRTSGNDLSFTMLAAENDDWLWGGWNYWSCWLEADPNNPATVNGKGWFQAIKEGVVGGQVINENVSQPVFEGSDEVVGGDESAVDWHSVFLSSWHREQFDRVDQAWQFDDSAGTFVDETADARSETANDVQPFPTGAGVDDYFALGQGVGPNQGSATAQKFNEVEVDIGTSGVGTYTVTWEYWNGSSWAALSNVTDNTNNFKAGIGVHAVTFDIPGDWAETTINGSASLFYVRARRDGGTVDTDPLFDNVNLINRTNKDKVNLDFDSFYMAWGENANARIVLADNATFTSATRATVSPHTSWSTTRVEDSLRKASHAGFSGLHVHLIKADNTRIYVGQLG